MKPFSERNPVLIAVIGIAAFLGVVVVGFQYDKLPFLTSTRNYSAYFADASGLMSGAPVQVSGYPVGKVSDVRLDGSRVLVAFTVEQDVELGEGTEAAIKTKTLLGSKILNLIPRGDGRLSGTIPLERTTSPYQLPDALGDLTATISGLNTDQLSESLATLSQTFSSTPPELKIALEGVARFSQTLDTRDAQLRRLLANANEATSVLAQRADQVVGLVSDTNALLASLRSQSTAVDQISSNISALSTQLRGLIGGNREQMHPALNKLNDVLTILDNRKENLQISIKRLNEYAMSLGESVSSGPFFKAYLVNLLPGQFLQPFIDAAFSDLGVDPATLPPSQLGDPQTGQPATPPLPPPFPRTGQGGEPNLTLPDAITGKPGDPRYPYREPLPAPPPGGPPPGPPAPLAPGQAANEAPTLVPNQQPAPGEAAPDAPTQTGDNP